MTVYKYINYKTMNNITKSCIKKIPILISKDTEDVLIRSVEILNNRKGCKGILPCGTKCLIMTSIFIDRLKKTCTIGSDNVNLLKTCMILSYKLSEDYTYLDMFNNIFELSKKDIFNMELEICKALDFKLHINNQDYSRKIVEVWE